MSTAVAEINKRLLDEAAYDINRGEIARGKETLSKVLSTDPTNSLALLWLTKCTQNLHERAWLFEEVLRHDPTNPHALKGSKVYRKYLRSGYEPAWISAARDLAKREGTSPQGGSRPAGPLPDQVQPIPPKRTPETASPSAFPWILAITMGSIALFFVWQCSRPRQAETVTPPPAVDTGAQTALRAVQNQRTALADNMHMSIGTAFVILESQGHTTGIDGWSVQRFNDHYEVYFTFSVDGDTHTAEWWYMPDGRILTANEWALVLMGQ